MDSEEKQDTSSSFMDVNGAESVVSSGVESSNLTTIGSEVPESVTTTVRSDRDRKTNVPEEHCSKCLNKQNEKAAATHFCKECKPYGKYLCHICLREHNKWTHHKRIFSLSECKSEHTNREENKDIRLKQTPVKKQEFMKKWFNSSAREVLTTESQSIDEGSDDYCDPVSSLTIGQLESSGTLQTPPADYSVIDSTSLTSDFNKTENQMSNCLLDNYSRQHESDRTIHEDKEGYYDTVSSGTIYASVHSAEVLDILQTPSADYSNIVSVNKPVPKSSDFKKNENQRPRRHETANLRERFKERPESNRYDKLNTDDNQRSSCVHRYDSLERLQQIYPDINTRGSGEDSSDRYLEIEELYQTRRRMTQLTNVHRYSDYTYKSFQRNPLFHEEDFPEERKKTMDRCLIL